MNFDRSFLGALVLTSAILAACGDDSVSEGSGGGGTSGGGSPSVTTGQGGAGGAGGSHPDDPCFDAGPAGFNHGGDGSCDDWQTGVECPWVFGDTITYESGVVECVDGQWTRVDCPLFDTGFACPDEGTALDACGAVWSGLICPWATADAGFSCEGRAQCQDGRWVSLGVDSSEEHGGGGAGGGS